LLIIHFALAIWITVGVPLFAKHLLERWGLRA